MQGRLKPLFLALAAGVILASLAITSRYLPDSRRTATGVPVVNGTYRRLLNQRNNAENVAFVFTGRWKFLRIQLPYLCRDLRQNGGVLDKVWFMMINYDEETRANLTKFTQLANKLYNKEVFIMHYFGYQPPDQPSKKTRFKLPYDEILSLVTEYPQNKYFKLDDDIVYIHPNAFSSMIDREISSCLIHFFNIAGSNWRCSWLHQKLGVYDYQGVNPQQLSFDYDPFAKCGWRKYSCAALTLDTFLHHYHNKSLDAYHFDTHYIHDGKRFSINAFLLDVHTIDIKAISNTISWENKIDDEKWLTVAYTANAERANCVIGSALVVHFSYSRHSKKLVKKGYLKRFEELVRLQRNQFNISHELWNILSYKKII